MILLLLRHVWFFCLLHMQYMKYDIDKEFTVLQNMYITF